jgi:hypothetical protein
MKHALPVLLSTASICASACLIPGGAAANGADANAQPIRRNSILGKATRPAGGHMAPLSARSIRLRQEALSGRMVIPTVIAAIT